MIRTSRIKISTKSLISENWKSQSNANNLIEIYTTKSTNPSLLFRVPLKQFKNDQKRILFELTKRLHNCHDDLFLKIKNVVTMTQNQREYLIIETIQPYKQTLFVYHNSNKLTYEELIFEMKSLIDCYVLCLKLNLPISISIEDMSVATVKDERYPYPQLCITPYAFLKAFIRHCKGEQLSQSIHSSFSQLFQMVDTKISQIQNCEPYLKDICFKMSKHQNGFDDLMKSKLMPIIQDLFFIHQFNPEHLRLSSEIGMGSFGRVGRVYNVDNENTILNQFKKINMNQLMINPNQMNQQQTQFFNQIHGIDDNVFAIKECSTNASRLLYKEAFILKSMNHINIVKCYGFQFLNKTFFPLSMSDNCFPHGCMMMEYCPYGNLVQYYQSLLQQRQRISFDLINIIFGQISCACLYLHYCKRYVHRDIKMENILVKTVLPFPVIKLCDFGVTRTVDISMVSNATTPICANLSILQGEEYSDDCDLFSIGCCLYYLMYGKYPCASCKVVGEIINRIQQKQIKFSNIDDNQQIRCVNELVSMLMVLDSKKGNYSWELFKRNDYVVYCLNFVKRKFNELNIVYHIDF